MLEDTPIDKMLLTVLVLNAEMQRMLILGRLNSGRDLAKRKDVKKIDPKGVS